MKGFNFFIPITKIDEEKREVYGVVAEEIVDKTKEIFDYASSKPYFEAWSEEFKKATDGDSLGNVRAMHNKIAAGKLTQLDFDDEAKKIEACARIVDENEWLKCKEKVYTGFSIGGTYIKRWKDVNIGATRYTADPHEVSIVDNPCIPTALFTAVKMDDNTSQALADSDFAKAFSFEEIRSLLSAAADERLSTPWDCGWCYIIATYSDYFIFEYDGKTYQLAYTITDDGVAFTGDAVEVVTQYVPVNQNKTEGNKLDNDTVNKTNDETATDDAELNKGQDTASNTENNDQAEENQAAEEDLTKAGSRNNAADQATIQEMHDKSIGLGAACKCSKCGGPLKCGKCTKDDDADDDGGDIEDAANGLKDNAFNKAIEEVTALSGRLTALEETCLKLTEANNALNEQVKELSNEPKEGGPVLRVVDKALAGGDAPNTEPDSQLESLKIAMSLIDDPLARQAISQKMALIGTKEAQKHPINMRR